MLAATSNPSKQETPNHTLTQKTQKQELLKQTISLTNEITEKPSTKTSSKHQQNTPNETNKNSEKLARNNNLQRNTSKKTTHNNSKESQNDSKRCKTDKQIDKEIQRNTMNHLNTFKKIKTSRTKHTEQLSKNSKETSKTCFRTVFPRFLRFFLGKLILLASSSAAFSKRCSVSRLTRPRRSGLRAARSRAKSSSWTSKTQMERFPKAPGLKKW